MTRIATVQSVSSVESRMKSLARLHNLNRRFVSGRRRKMTKTEWKLFAMWSAGNWASHGPLEWEDWYPSHRRSAWTLGIATEEAELRGVAAFCKYITTRSDYPKNIEATANSFGADQFKGH
jgi:hypothetical protein